MFFQSLNALRGQVASIGLSMSFTGDNQFTVIVNPKLTPELSNSAPHLASPFVLTATAQELDAGFAGEFSYYEKTFADLAAQAKAQCADLKAKQEATAKASQSKATKAIAAKAPTANATQLAALINTGTPVSDSQDDDDSVTAATEYLNSSTSSPSNSLDSLFDEEE